MPVPTATTRCNRIHRQERRRELDMDFVSRNGIDCCTCPSQRGAQLRKNDMKFARSACEIAISQIAGDRRHESQTRRQAGAVVISDSEPLVASKRWHDALLMLNLFGIELFRFSIALPASCIAKLIKRNVHRALVRTSSALTGEACYAISNGDRECKIL